MKKGNLIFAAICAALGVIIISVALGYPTAADYGTGVPGPGLWPIVISVVMLACAAAMAFKAIKLPPAEQGDLNFWTPGTRRVYITMGILFVYMLALEFTGFLIATAALLFLLIQWFAKKKPWITALIAVGITLVVYFAFKSVLNVPIDSFGIFVI